VKVNPLFVALLVLAPLLSTAHAQKPPPNVRGNHLDYPVYYELNVEDLLPHEENLSDLSVGLLWLRHYPPVDVTDFDWSRGGIDDYSWWIQVEELRFLLPFIESDLPERRTIAERWFKSWYASQAMDPDANGARWGEPMSASFRAMVLVLFLKTEETREEPNDDLIGLLRETIYQHQEYLANPGHFNSNSNHGLVEALGLLEVTRVFPDTTMERLGLERMYEIVEKSVSKKGVHKEHSPVYHFVFLYWVDHFTAYLGRLPFLDEAIMGRLLEYAGLMKEAAYFMYDHGGVIAQLGDSDSVSVDDRYPDYGSRHRRGAETTLFDAEAGYAIYKGNSSRGDKRFVVFANQNLAPQLRYHFHDDVLSVYYAHDGETILGDGGKFEYSDTPERKYFVSPAAHNTIFPMQYLRTRRPRYALFLADSTSTTGIGKQGDVSFYARVRHPSAYVERSVRVPRGDRLEVVDVLTWPPVLSDEDRNRYRTAEPQYSGMVWNMGPAVVSLRSVRADTSGSYEWHLTSASGRRFKLVLTIDGGVEGARHRVEVLEGSRSPDLGWYSPKMFVKKRKPSILVTVRPEHVLRVTTTIEPLVETPFALRILTKGY